MSINAHCGCGAPLRAGRARCNPCHASYMKRWRKDNPAEVRAQRALKRARTRTLIEETLLQKEAARRLSRETVGLRLAARARARQSKKRGSILEKPCLVCGAGNAQMHHVDYDRPLDVVWLCDGHHKGWHRFWRALVLEQFKRWVAEQTAPVQRAA